MNEPPISRPVLVTGAAGFIGAAVVRCLAGDGIAVLAGQRNSALPTDIIGLSGVTAVACNLDDVAQVRKACRGADAIVHAAYGDPAELAAQAERLLDAASAAGITRIVLLSSIAVYGAAQGRCDETRPLGGAVDAYGSGKQRCEELLRIWVQADEERRAVVFRPGAVYGRSSRLWIENMISRINAGGIGDFGSDGEGLAPLIHVDDVARAVAIALAHPWREDQPPLLTLNLTYPQDVTWNTYFDALARRAGLDTVRRITPWRLRLQQMLRLPAKAMAKAGLPTIQGPAATPGSAEMALFARRSDYPVDAARREIGWEPGIDLETGLRLCFDQDTSPSP
jgi:nucleoside-diphosphate-sugar epimerase